MLLDEDWEDLLDETFQRVLETRGSADALKAYHATLSSMVDRNSPPPLAEQFFRHLIGVLEQHLGRHPQLSGGAVGLFLETLADDLAEASDATLHKIGKALQRILAEALEAAEPPRPDDPQSPEARASLLAIEASQLVEEGCVDDAVEAFRRALRCAPECPEALMGLGLLLADRGELEEAQGFLEHLARLRPDDFRVHLYLGRILLDRRELGPAMEHFSRSLRLNSFHAETYYRVAILFRRAGFGDVARRYFKHFRQLAPDAPSGWVLKCSIRIEGPPGKLILDGRPKGKVPGYFPDIPPGPREVAIRTGDAAFGETLMFSPGKDYLLTPSDTGSAYDFVETAPPACGPDSSAPEADLRSVLAPYLEALPGLEAEGKGDGGKTW